jgi:hypothetical protein
MQYVPSHMSSIYVVPSKWQVLWNGDEPLNEVEEALPSNLGRPRQLQVEQLVP